MGIESFWQKTKEIKKVLNDKYLLMFLITISGISKDSVDFYTPKEKLVHNNEKRIQQRQSYPGGNIINEETANTGPYAHQNNALPPDSNESETDSLTTQDTLSDKQPYNFMDQYLDLFVVPISTPKDEDKTETKIEATDKSKIEKKGSVEKLASVITGIVEEYKNAPDTVAFNINRGVIAASALEKKLDPLNKKGMLPLLKEQLSAFSDKYKEYDPTRIEKIKKFILNNRDTVNNSRIYNIPENELDDFIFLVFFLDYAESTGKLAEELSFLETKKSMTKHLQKYKNADDFDEEFYRTVFYTHFLNESYKKFNRTSEQEKIRKNRSGGQDDFKDFLVRRIPIELVLNIAREYRIKQKQ